MAAKKAAKRPRIKKGPLEKKWDSYTGTGINASKGKDALVLREGIGGGEYAVVKLFGGCWTNSPMKVIEEIKTTNYNDAKSRFDEIAKKLGFKEKPVRGIGLLFA
jgi:hypothetical protein